MPQPAWLPIEKSATPDRVEIVWFNTWIYNVPRRLRSCLVVQRDSRLKICFRHMVNQRSWGHPSPSQSNMPGTWRAWKPVPYQQAGENGRLHSVLVGLLQEAHLINIDIHMHRCASICIVYLYICLHICVLYIHGSIHFVYVCVHWCWHVYVHVPHIRTHRPNGWLSKLGSFCGSLL